MIPDPDTLDHPDTLNPYADPDGNGDWVLGDDDTDPLAAIPGE